MTRKVLLIAGEASGDLHAAALVREMRRLEPALCVRGIGGAHLRAAGMEVFTDTNSIQTMGITETFGTLGRLLRAYRRVRRDLTEERPDLVVLVDFPEFNLLVARRAKRLGIPVFYFIGPQVWAWRRGRVRKIARRVDRMAVVFPFEPQLYNNGRPLAEFVGHPLLDVVAPSRTRAETRRLYHLDDARPVVALLPGSREKEVRYLLAPMLEAARALRRDGWQPILALAPRFRSEDVSRLLGGGVDFPIAENDTYNVVAAADAAVVASGTATLETALLARPMVIVYRVAPLTYALAKLLIRIDAIGMPNIILGRRVFTELIQSAANGPAIERAVRDAAARHASLERELREVRRRLGRPGAAARAARLALELVE